MDLNKIAAAALENIGDSVRADLRGRLEEIKKKRDVLEAALGRARERVLKALPRDLRAEFAKEDVAFLFFMKIDDEAPDFAHFITDEVREAVEQLIDCEKIIETFEDEEPAPRVRPTEPRQPRLRPTVPVSGIVFKPRQPPGLTSPGGQIEKIILEALHLDGRFRNTAVFAKQYDVIPEACAVVLKRLRERGVIIMEGKSRHASYILADPPPAPPAAVDPPPTTPQPSPQAPPVKMPVFTTARDLDAMNTNRDALIEKAILEAIHLQGEFRNTKKFREQQDITYAQCVAVLKGLRKRGVISLEGTGLNTSYVFKDPQLRLKDRSAAPAEPPPAPPAAVIAEPAAIDPPPAAAAPRPPAVEPPSAPAPQGPAGSESREKLTEFIRAIEEGYFSDARGLYEKYVGPQGRGKKLSSFVELQGLMHTAVLDLIKACFDTLNQNSNDIAVIAKQSRRIASLSGIIVAADHRDTGMPREELRSCLMPHIARLPVKVKKEVLDRLQEDEIFDAKSIAEAPQAAEPEQAAETEADIVENFRQAIRAGDFYKAKDLYVANLAKKIELDSIVLGRVRIALDELKSCRDSRSADRIIGIISESVRLFRGTDIAPGIEDSEFRTIILNASRDLSEAYRRALRAELSSYLPPEHRPTQSPPPRAVDNNDALIESAILQELRGGSGSLSNITAFVQLNDFTYAACYMVLRRLCAQGVISKRGRGLNAAYMLTDSAPTDSVQRPTTAASVPGAARQPVARRYDRADRPGSADPPFVLEFLKEVGKGNIPAARAVYEHDSTRQGALNNAALRHIGIRLDWLASNTSASEDDIRGQCRAMRHAANAILKTDNSEYGMPLPRLQDTLSGQIAGLPDTMRRKVLAELKDIFSHQNVSAGASAAPPAPPAPPASEAPRPAPERGPTEDQMRNRVADFVYELKFEDARRVNTDKENFWKGVLMAMVRHLMLVAGTDEASNSHLQSASDILSKTRQYIPPEMTTRTLNAAISTMNKQPDRYPPTLIFKIKFFLRQYL